MKVANTGSEYLEAVNKSLDLVNTMFGAYQELAKSVTAPVEDKAEKAEVKKSEDEDKEDKEDKDDEKKSESTKDSGKVEHDKAPEGDPASKSEDKDDDEGKDKEDKEDKSEKSEESQVEKSAVAVTNENTEEDNVEKSASEIDSGYSKDTFIGVINKSIRDVENYNGVIDNSSAIKSYKDLKQEAEDADFISNELVDKYNEI